MSWPTYDLPCHPSSCREVPCLSESCQPTSWVTYLPRPTSWVWRLGGPGSAPSPSPPGAPHPLAQGPECPPATCRTPWEGWSRGLPGSQGSAAARPPSEGRELTCVSCVLATRIGGRPGSRAGCGHRRLGGLARVVPQGPSAFQDLGPPAGRHHPSFQPEAPRLLGAAPPWDQAPPAAPWTLCSEPLTIKRHIRARLLSLSWGRWGRLGGAGGLG